jgi:hypothetical protein
LIWLRVYKTATPAGSTGPAATQARVAGEVRCDRAGGAAGVSLRKPAAAVRVAVTEGEGESEGSW